MGGVYSFVEHVSVPLKGRMVFKSLSDIRRGLKGTQYLVKPFLEREVTLVLYGDSGAYKSFLALDQGLCVAYGVDYHGHRVHQGPVFYICGEGHGGIGRRIEAWLIHHKLTDTDAPFYVSEVPACLIDEGNAQELARIIDETSDIPPVLVIIDTLSTNMGDGDESKNPDIAQLIVNVNTHLRDRFGACVEIVHHVGHGDKERERGAYAIRGNTDARILIKATPGHGCSMHSQKVKDGAPFEPMAFRSEVVVIPELLDSEGEQASSLVLEQVEYVPPKDAKDLPGKAELIFIVLEDLYQQARENLERGGYPTSQARVSLKDWREECFRRKVVTGKDKKAAGSAFRKAKAELLKSGLFEEKDGFVYLAGDG